jgi:hypothetical protein
MRRPDPKRLVRRPRYRRIFGKRSPSWLVLEPNRLGLAGGAVFATIAMLIYWVRGLTGAQMPPSQVLVGVGITFVISYAAVGIFVWYLLYVVEREFGPPPLEEVQRRRLLSKGRNGTPVEEVVVAEGEGGVEEAGDDAAAAADTMPESGAEEHTEER